MKRIVIKLSSNLIIEKRRIQQRWLKELAILIKDLQESGCHVWLVTSGAGALYKLKNKKEIHDWRGYSEGQELLFSLYSSIFSETGLSVAEILLSKDEFKNREKYLNIRSRLENLGLNNTVSLINEKEYINSKHKFSDNDEIAGLIASIVGADRVILASNVDGLIDNEGHCITRIEPGQKSWKQHIRDQQAFTLGRGGMLLKCKAAEHSANRGVDAVICNGKSLNNLREVIHGYGDGTLFAAHRRKKAKKRWIFDSKDFFNGEIIVDPGLADVMKSGKPASILAIGISDILGDFRKKEVVSIRDENSIIGYGEIRYDAADARKLIKGKEKKLLIHYNDYVRVI